MRLSIIFTAFALFTTVLHANEAVNQDHAYPEITLATVVSDLEQRADHLSRERAAMRNEDKEGKAPLSTMDKEKSETLFAITQHLDHRVSQLFNKTTPSDPYYEAIQQQLHAGCHLDTLQVWWKHCRKGTNFESLAEIDELPLMIELQKAKAMADQLVADNQPIVEPTQSGENQTLDPMILSRLTGGNSILNQIDSWKDMPETEKSKIISR